jgi:hypothetical protein
MQADTRVDAGIDMDGTRYIPATGLSRPVMFLGAPHHSPGGLDTSWDRDWNLTTGWKRWLVVAGTQHASFTDLAIFADQLGIDFGATTGTRSMEITRRYNLAAACVPAAVALSSTTHGKRDAGHSMVSARPGF